MDRVCAWCGKMLEEGAEGPEGLISHGICDDCKKLLLEEESLVSQKG